MSDEKTTPSTTSHEPAIEALGSITLIAAGRWRPSRLVWCGLFAIIGVAAFWSLLPGPLLTARECLVAQTSREMINRGDWVVPYFSGMVHLQKSPLSYWSVAAVSTALDRFSDPIVRLPSAIYGLALAALMALFGWRAFRAASLAWFCAAVTAFSAVWLYYSHMAIADMQRTFWCTAAGAMLWLGTNASNRARRIAWFTGAGAAMGMAMLTKMPVVLVVLLPGFFIYLIMTSRTRKIFTYLLDALPGILLMLLIWLPWVLLVLHRLDNQAVGLKWFREVILRAEGEVGHVYGSWYFYLVRIWVYILPWALFLPEAIASPWLRRYRPWRDVLIFALCMAMFNLLFFSVAGCKRDHYLLPAMPWFLLLLTVPVWRFFAGPIYENRKIFTRIGLTQAALAVGAGIAIWVWLGHTYVEMAGAAAVPLGILVGGLVLGGLTLAARARLDSFRILLLTTLVVFCVSWMQAHKLQPRPQRETAFAEDVRRILPPEAVLHSLAGPDPQLVYYSRILMPRVVSDLQTETRIHGMHIPQSGPRGFQVTVHALIERFQEPQATYVVSDYDKWTQLQGVDAFMQTQPKLLYRQSGFEERADKDLVLFGSAAAVTK